jgi:hypothetical protein
MTCSLASSLELRAAVTSNSPRLAHWRDAGFAPPRPNDDTVRMLRSTRAALVRFEMRRARMTTEERKADTRRKIQLGGLIAKARLAFEAPAVLLGMLTAGAKVLNSPSALESRRRWKEIGDRAFGLGPSR